MCVCVCVLQKTCHAPYMSDVLPALTSEYLHSPMVTLSVLFPSLSLTQCLPAYTHRSLCHCMLHLLSIIQSFSHSLYQLTSVPLSFASCPFHAILWHISFFLSSFYSIFSLCILLPTTDTGRRLQTPGPPGPQAAGKGAKGHISKYIHLI